MSERPGYIPEEFKGDKKRIVFADISEAAEAQAADVAAARMTEKPEEYANQPKGWKKFFSGNFLKTSAKRIWKHNLWEPYYQQKEKRKAKETILDSGNLYANEEGSGNTASHDQAVKDITSRFEVAEEFKEDFIHEAAGEQRQVLGNDRQANILKNRILSLARQFAGRDLNDPQVLSEFNARQQQLFTHFKTSEAVDKEVLGKGEMFASNLLEVVKWMQEQVRQATDQQAALERLGDDFQIVVGKAKAGVRTEAQFNAVDNVVDIIQKHTHGVFNEATVSAAVAVVYSVGKKVVSGSVKRAATFLGVGMGAMGVTSALKESRKIEMERAQHAREMAQGRKVEGDESKAERRKEVEESRIEFKKAKDLEAELNRTLFDRLQSKDISQLTETEYQEAMRAVAEIDTRIKISDKGVNLKPKTSRWQFWRSNQTKKIDLIGYSDITQVENERNSLDIAKTKAKLALKRWAEANGGRNFNNDLVQASDNHINVIFNGDKGILKQQERFKAMKRKRVLQAFKKGALWGGALGTLVQEVRAGFDGDLHGLADRAGDYIKGVKHFVKKDEEVTLLEGALRRGQEYFDSPVHAAGPPHDEILGSQTFRMHDGIKWVEDSTTGDPNDFYLTDASGTRLSENLELNPDRSLTPDAKKWLVDHGYSINETLNSKVNGFQGLDAAETKKMFPSLTEHARVDWHDEPGQYWSEIHKAWLEFEGKQQMGYLEKVGDKVFLNTSKVIANFKEEVMERLNDPHFGQVAGYTNPDGTPFVDTKMVHLKEEILKAIKSGELEKRFQAVIIPTDGANKEGLSDIFEGADSKGRIYLGDWSKYFTDPKMLRDGHLPVRFLEMRFMGHVIGTAQGSPEIASVPITEIIPGPGERPIIVVPPFPAYAPGRKPLESTIRIVEPPPPPPPPPPRTPVISGAESGFESAAESGSETPRRRGKRSQAKEARMSSVVEDYFHNDSSEEKEEKGNFLRIMQNEKATPSERKRFREETRAFYKWYKATKRKKPFKASSPEPESPWTAVVKKAIPGILSDQQKNKIVYYIGNYLKSKQFSGNKKQKAKDLVRLLRIAESSRANDI
jgi:hypothetical protein